MKEKIIAFVKKETVFLVAVILAVVSAFVVPPDKGYRNYIDFRVLGILLMLMIVMEGLSKNGFFDAVGEKLLSKTRRLWQLVFVLVFLCFFFAMLITNDVALITFVPFAIMMLKKTKKEELIAPVVVLQTLAANLGSMLTPIGNPQNLYLYNLAGYDIGTFVLIMLPYTIFAAVLLLCSILLLKGKRTPIMYEPEPKKPLKRQTRRKNLIYLMLFVFSVLVVARIFPWQVVLLATFLTAFVLDADILKRVDYVLLLTFIAFFIFTGNIARIPEVSRWLQELVVGHEVSVAVMSSQVISNVPATLLLSGFTDKWPALLIGVNIGGLGTLIASLASLISYKLYVKTADSKTSRYLLTFTLYSIVFLAILVPLYFLLN